MACFVLSDTHYLIYGDIAKIWRREISRGYGYFKACFIEWVVLDDIILR